MAETARRGGPIEVAGIRFRGIAQQRQDMEIDRAIYQTPYTLPSLKKMPKVGE